MALAQTEKRDIGRFVRARREAVPASSFSEFRQRRRHVAHLTQGELAQLAGVSTVVISQIEQARYPNLNPAIVRKIGRVLQFTSQQEMFALGLLNPATETQKGIEPAPSWLKASIKDVQHPVFVLNPAYDMVTWNPMAEAMMGSYAPEFFSTRNAVVPVFGMPEMKRFFMDWTEFSTSMVSGLRMAYSVHPEYRTHVSNLAEKIAASDSTFRALWFKDDPLVKPTIEKSLDHPSAGHMRMIQMATDVVEVPYLTKTEFLPADNSTRAKMRQLQL